MPLDLFDFGGRGGRGGRSGGFAAPGDFTTIPTMPGTSSNQYFTNMPSAVPNAGGGPSAGGDFFAVGSPTSSGGRNPWTSGQGGWGYTGFKPSSQDLGQGFGTESPMDPGLSGNFLNWLQSNVGKGVPGYTGALAAGPNNLLKMLQGIYGGGTKNVPGMGILSDIAGGGGPGSGTMQEMSQTGAPTDVGPAWDAMKAAMQRQIAEGGADLKGQFAFSGGMAGTPFGNAATDYYSQATKDLNAQLAQMQAQASEAAAGRRMGAGEFLGSQAAGAAGVMGQEGLSFLGQGSQMGEILQQIQQQGLDKQYQEFLRTQPQYNPLLNMMYGGSTTFSPIFGQGKQQSGILGDIFGGAQTGGNLAALGLGMATL